MTRDETERIYSTHLKPHPFKRTKNYCEHLDISEEVAARVSQRKFDLRSLFSRKPMDNALMDTYEARGCYDCDGSAAKEQSCPYYRKGERLEGKVEEKSSEWKKPLHIVAMAGVGVGLLLLSPTLTGNAIGNLSIKTSGIIGTIMFVFGISGSYFYTRGNRK